VLAGRPASGDRGAFFLHLAREARPLLLVRGTGDALEGTLRIGGRRIPLPAREG
jgi:hypothetical protein